MNHDLHQKTVLSPSPSLNEHPNLPSSMAISPLQSKKRKPFGKLTNLVNTFEAGKAKIHNSTKNFTKSMSLMPRFSELSVFDRPFSKTNDPLEENVSDVDTDIDKTLDDDDFLSSPLVKEKRQSQCSRQGEVRRSQSHYQGKSQWENHYRDNSHLPHTCLKTFKSNQDLIPRIDENEMHKIVTGEYASQFDEFIVIDCRFPYEFDGGHIINALNISSQTDLEERFVANHVQSDRRRLLIFHCEYSIFRGPTMASHLRKADRIHNADCYPRLFYPDIVVLEGGYKKFFDSYKEYCTPQAYVEMKDIKHKKTCQVEMNKVIQASKLTRARSFNHFNPHQPSHHRSSSNLTPSSFMDYSSSWNFPSSAGPPSLARRKNSSKIYKRQDSRRDLKLNITSSSFSFPAPNAVDSPTGSEISTSTYFDDDLVPPSTLLRNHSKCLSLLSTSINSSEALVCSDNYSSAFTSSDSLHLSSSPFNESIEFFDTPFSSASGIQNSTQNSSASMSPYKFPSAIHSTPAGSNGHKLHRARLSSVRPCIRTPRSHGFGLSSPVTSSPLTTPMPASSYESSSSSNTVAVLDKINDTPVHFSLGYRYPFDSTLQHSRLQSYQHAYQQHRPFNSKDHEKEI